jgi:gliding motility-associated lipoprotein GldH
MLKKTLITGLAGLLLNACSFTTGTFEKSVSLPDHQWPSSVKPDIEFNITDTVSLYNIYIVLRHSDAYHFNNIYVRATVTEPGGGRPKAGDYDLQLANNEKGWIGTAMDDIYDARLLIQPRTRFTKAGTYHFVIEQLMREDPLKNMLSVGLRVEKMQ